MVEPRGSYRFWMGTHEEQMPLVRPIRRWRIILKWKLKPFGRAWSGIGVTQDRGIVCRAVVNAVKILRVPSRAGNFLTN
jgi:hypothetical protein